MFQYDSSRCCKARETVNNWNGNGETIVANHNVSQVTTSLWKLNGIQKQSYLNGTEIDRDFTTSHGSRYLGTLNLTITWNIQDSVNYAIVVDINDMNVKSRPSPPRS